MRVLLAGLALASLLAANAVHADPDGVAAGDAYWSARAEGERDGLARREPILAAVRAYQGALDSHPEDLVARWKLLRALHFAGEFATPDEDEAHECFERARRVSEQGIDLLAERVGSPVRLDELSADEVRRRLAAANVPLHDAARLHFWAAIHWGTWSRRAGLLDTVRRGVANRIHRYTSIALAFEPGYDEGGPFRLLGRMHAVLPRVPLVSGWIDRDRAIPLLEQAYALAPANPGNRLLLALTLLDLAPDRRGEALALLEQVAGLTPRDAMRIEDLAMRKDARDRLRAD